MVDTGWEKIQLQLLVSSNRYKDDHLSQELIADIRGLDYLQSDSDSISYYDYPVYTDYENRDFRVDFCILSKNAGFVVVKVIDADGLDFSAHKLQDADEDVVEFCGLVTSKFVKSRTLKQGVSGLKFSIRPVIFVSGGHDVSGIETESLVVTSIESLREAIQVGAEQLEPEVYDEARSIIEGAKAIARPPRRFSEGGEVSKKVQTIRTLEQQIVNFDARQREVALALVPGPHRIRGLAGSGKTVILCMKAALLHVNSPTEPILITYFTRSLQSTIRTMVTKFYRHLRDEDPDWNVIHIRHGWGGRSVPGVYYDACVRAGVSPMTFGEAKSASRDPREDAFATACRSLLETGRVKPYYKYVFIDEGQDFPDQFYRLAYRICQGDGDEKSIIWAYDELQNILDIKMRGTDELFGVDNDGVPLLSLDRAAKKLPYTIVNDSVLKKCYRNQGPVLVAAHALGFGIYSKQIVQLLQDTSHWQDVGYTVEKGGTTAGQETVICRPLENSPLVVEDKASLIDTYPATTATEEVEWVVNRVRALINDGVAPDEIMVVCLDDRYVKTYLDAIGSRLTRLGIGVNHMLADRYTQPPFKIEDKVTLSTIYRAKGNEAYQVFIVGADAINGALRRDRNKLFTAMTRSKAWVSVSGMGERAKDLLGEISVAIENFPCLKFTMPDIKEVEFIQRDLSERATKAKEARDAYLNELSALGLSEGEVTELLGERGDPKGIS